MAIPAFPLLLSLLCSMVAPMSHHGQSSTQSPYIVVEDTGETQEDITEIQEEITDKADTVTCKDVMANNGLNFSSFWHGAAHGVHSIYLEEIREYFEPEAPAANRIPVVNKNLSAEEVILFDSPLAGYDEDFLTMAMKVMAYFMLNDRPDFSIQGINTLEKATHQFHMHEIYAAAAPIYRRMKENPPKDSELCPCVNDITGNGILKEITNIASKLKYFNSQRMPRARGFNWEGYWGDKKEKAIQKRSADSVSPDMIAQYEQQYLANSTHDTAKVLMGARPWVKNTLVGPEQWVSYEAMLTYSMLQEEGLNDFAVFMYCKLKQPGLDHPKELFD
jgi:hypothetical protein